MLLLCDIKKFYIISLGGKLMGKLSMKFLFLLLFLSISILFSCQSKKTEKIVFLGGGNAWELFESYLKKLEDEKKPYKLGAIKVKIWDGKAFKEYSIRWTDYLSGDPLIKVWQRKLKNVEAISDPQVIAQAEKYGWEIYVLEPKSSGLEKETKDNTFSIAKTASVCSPEATSHINLGLQFVKDKQIDNAIKEFTRAKDISPSCSLAYANLISAHVLKGNYNLAIDIYKEIKERLKDNGFLHITGAIAYIKKGDHDYALEALKNALEVGYKDRSVLESSEFLPLIKVRKKDFCNLVEKYNLTIKSCL